MGGSIGICLFHNSKKFFGGFCVLFSEAWDFYISISALQDIENGFLFEQIKAASSINLEVADSNLKTFFCQFEQFIYD